MREAIGEAFWNCVDQKWRDALNVAAAEPPTWGAGSSGRAAPQEGGKKVGAAEATRLAKAAVHVTGIDEKRHCQGDNGRTCMFKDVMGCPGTHPPWHCKVFRKLSAREREKIIKDNQLCPFCLLHDKDKPCGAKQKPVARSASNCKGRHIQKLHDFLKDVFREENQVHVVHGDDGWEESEEAWELGEEEMMIVGTVQQEDDCSWQDASKSWLEQEEKEETGIYQVGTCQGADGTIENRRGGGSTGGRGGCRGRLVGPWARRSGDRKGGGGVLPRTPDEGSTTRRTQTSQQQNRSVSWKGGGSKKQDCPRQGQREKEGQEEGPRGGW
jgi:hypothetical protein